VQADPVRLTTIFEHLIRNALDATRIDGRIMFETGLMNGVANVSISDTGAGMSPDFARSAALRAVKAWEPAPTRRASTCVP